MFLVNAVDPNGQEIEFQFFSNVRAAPTTAVTAARARKAGVYELKDRIKTLLPFVESRLEALGTFS